MACIRGEWKDVWLGTWSSRLVTRLQVLCYSPIANQHLSPNFPTTNGHVENQQKHGQITSLVWDGVKNLQIQKINTVKVLNSLSWMLSLSPWIEGQTKTQVLFSRIFGTYHLKTRDISLFIFLDFLPYLWKRWTIERAYFWNWVVQPETAGVIFFYWWWTLPGADDLYKTLMNRTDNVQRVFTGEIPRLITMTSNLIMNIGHLARAKIDQRKLVDRIM